MTSIDNRTRDLPACSTVPQQTAPPRNVLTGIGRQVRGINAGVHKLSKNVGVILKFSATEWWHKTCSILKNHSSGVTCGLHCYLALCARGMWTDTQFRTTGRKLQYVFFWKRERERERERERGHPIVYYQICIIYYVPSIHNIIKTSCNNYNYVIFGYMFRP